MDWDKQKKKYNGHQKFHRSFVILWVELFAMIILVNVIDDSSTHVGSIFSDRMIIRGQGHHIDSDDYFMRNRGFLGEWSCCSSVRN